MRRWIAPVLAALAVSVLAPSAHAAFTLTILEDGIDRFGPIVSNGLNTNASDIGTIAINVDAVNAVLQAFQINSLSVTTNSVGEHAGSGDDIAQLFQGGSIQLKSIAANTGDHTLEIIAFDDGYSFPITNPKIMTNSASSTFGNAVAGSRTFQGQYDDASTSVASGEMSFVPTPGNLSPKQDDLHNPLDSSGPPFSLKNTSLITLGTGSSTFGFQGTTFVTAVPEPTSLAMGLISLPALLALGRRMRRRGDQ
jgi:hypothetical protein